MKKPQHCGVLNNNVTNYIRTTCIYNRLTNALLGNMIRQRHMLSRRHTTVTVTVSTKRQAVYPFP